jgi:hypothetical protein
VKPGVSRPDDAARLGVSLAEFFEPFAGRPAGEHLRFR